DPHLYKASEGDVRKLAEAQLILYNGLLLEGKMGDILEKMARDRTVVGVAEVLDPNDLMQPEAYEGQYDPHVWFDASLWRVTTGAIADELIAFLPDHADTIRAAADAYIAELQELDDWAFEQIATVPEERRVLITAHDAFGYFGRRYDVQVVGLQGLSTATEAGLQDVDGLADMIVSRGVPAIFVESSVPRRAIEAVQAAVRAQDAEVTIGGELFSDALGPADSGADTYVGMFRHNIETIVGALQ
ncbi:MAG: zinc ABC transporter substrate-binding protein, partial [Acidobacteriota bacterium]